MKTNLPSFRWPMRTWMRVVCGGRYPLDDRNHATIYRSVTHAIHLYEYHATIRFGDVDVPLSPGDVTISPAGGSTTYDLPKPGHHYCIHFWPAMVQGEMMSLPLHLSLGASGRWVIDRVRDVGRYVQFRRAKGDLPDTQASMITQEILLWIAEQAARRAEPIDTRSSQVVEHLAELLNHRFAEPLCVADLSREVGLSQNYLARVFRERLGMTVSQYILQRRIEHAGQLLTDTDMSISQIGQRVGISDSQYFNKLFRRTAGVSPSVFRQRRKRQS